MLHRNSSPSLTRLAALTAAAGIGAIAVGLVAQYGFGLRPCVLCLIQRVPFALAGLLGLVALMPNVASHGRRLLLTVAGSAFLANAGIAVYHVGVEQHWWSFPVCSAADTRRPATVAELAEMSRKPAEVPCDKPAWQWHGITMAGFNIPYSGGLGLVLLLALRRRRKEVR